MENVKHVVMVKLPGTEEYADILVNYQIAKHNLKKVIKHPERFRNPELLAEFLNNIVLRAKPVNT